MKQEMSLVATNSYRYNYEMELWGLRNFTAKNLLDSWEDIYRFASTEESEDDVFFLADCFDVLNEKVKSLTDSEGAIVINKAKADLETMSIGENVLRLAG